MRFWVELTDHVPNGQTVTSLLRFNTFNTKKTYNESMSSSKGMAAVTTRVFAGIMLIPIKLLSLPLSPPLSLPPLSPALSLPLSLSLFLLLLKSI